MMAPDLHSVGISSFISEGFELIPAAFHRGYIDALLVELESLADAPGHRNLMTRFPAVAKIAASEKIQELLHHRTGQTFFPVRSIYFDKTPEANWLVPWHQDLTIAVQERIERDGYGPWSVKNGTVHVQPPLAILQGMIAVRIHLDDADENNGALRVLPGTHQLGRLDAAAIAAERARVKEIACPAKAGDLLLMRPLLLHASSPALHPAHRRVIHLEYASCALAEGLEWAETLPATIRK